MLVFSKGKLLHVNITELKYRSLTLYWLIPFPSTLDLRYTAPVTSFTMKRSWFPVWEVILYRTWLLGAWKRCDDSGTVRISLFKTSDQIQIHFLVVLQDMNKSVQNVFECITKIHFWSNKTCTKPNMNKNFMGKANLKKIPAKSYTLESQIHFKAEKFISDMYYTCNYLKMAWLKTFERTTIFAVDSPSTCHMLLVLALLHVT